MPIIPARKAVAFEVQPGDSIKITNTHGKQVCDFWALNPTDPRDYLSMVHTRTVLQSVVLRKGDSLYSTRRQPILTLEEDTTRGVHDMLWAACDENRYRTLGFGGYHDNCHDNMHNALRESFPGSRRAAEDLVPDPLNLFMNVVLNQHGGLEIRPPVSEKGQFVVLRAAAQLIVVVSSCPQDLAPANGAMPADCEYEVIKGDRSAERGTTLAAYAPKQLDPSHPDFGVRAGSKLMPTGWHLGRKTEPAPKRRVKIALSVDFDAVSHWLGTGCHKDNNMADYSSGIFAARVGVYRLLDTFRRNGLADRVTWFIPGHTAETFPEAAAAVVASGAEVGLHGYAHEGIPQMTVQQERDVLEKCIEVCQKLTGKKPRGYRAPMYTIRESTVAMLREHGFLYDSSLMHHDSQPYFAPSDPPIRPIDWSQPASSWLKPSTITTQTLDSGLHPLVELPCGWYNEDMMPMQYLPHLANSMGYVSTRVVEQMWRDKFMWLWENQNKTLTEKGGHRYEGDEGSADFVFPILLHPDTSGMAHIIGMVDRFLAWLKEFGNEVQFCRCEEIAEAWLASQREKRARGKPL